MPPTLTYPGVYINELPSGVHTITGVATSITAFVGRTARGPANQPTTIESFAEFERRFGGLDQNSRTSYAVRDFFLNGGGNAVMVRLYNGDINAGTVNIAKASFGLKAASPGTWGTKLRISIDQIISASVALAMGLNPADLFNLKLVDSSPGGLTETYRNVTLVKTASRRLDKVLAGASDLMLWSGADLDAAVTPPALPTQADLDAAIVAAAGTGSDGNVLVAADYLAAGKNGIQALENTDLFNLLCLPPDTAAAGTQGDIPSNVLDAAAAYCEKRRAMLLVDPPAAWNAPDKAIAAVDGLLARSKNAALYFPRLREQDPLNNGAMDTYVPCGAVAGVFARTDSQRGVWKAPAGTEATLLGVPELDVRLTDKENGDLNPLGINCLRAFPVIGRVVWGSRTLRGADLLTDQWKYVPVRRTALFLEESLYRGTQWVVFEPNDEPLWAQIRLNVGAFMNTLFRQGAFQGATPHDAYLVKCDKETTTQADIDNGIVNILVGFAPLKPAEFVVITIQQLAGQITV
jgi:phage tail sheath protein FI